MKINVIALRSLLSKKDKEIDALTKSFLENINDELFDNDISLQINAKEALMSVFLIETGGTESLFLKYAENLKDPVILLSTERNNSLPACFEIKTYLESKNMNCLLITGDSKDIAHFFLKITEIVSANKKLHKMNLGVIGKPSDWLISSVVDFGKVKDKFGISLLNIGTNELFGEINKKKYGNIRNLSKIKSKVKNLDTIEKALYIYGALKRLIDKYHLDGFTIRCFDLLDEYKNTACLALALLNEEGYICGCEGDVPSLLTMAVIKVLTNQPSFMANPSSLNFKDNKLILSHCTAPLSMLTDYEIMTHFESNLGCAIKGNFMNKEVTVCKITPSLDNIVILEGNITQNLSLPYYCRSQVEVQIEENKLFTLLDDSFGNHLILAYSNIADILLTYFSFVSLPDKDK